ncbi:SHOCT domain-containing protein [Virgibacillus salinus]|uniref:Putative membrane protein n=1 Tax=Virgibacillus salinus TaxID=553311 RepID=A0A1H1DU98_9BACI|nr:SHOCT domain-containing protein [Virgibacillus salinus]SDQ80122.1 putative membrane protein [Virgibacillus salinus]
MMGNMTGGGGFYGFGFFTILIILAIIIISVWMFKGPDNGSFRSSGDKSLETLKERLAKGEISEEEYDRLKRKLKE